jgi:prevent-host-death family protein
MTEAGIRELRNHLSQYIDRVRDGEEVVVTDRGTAVARIVPVVPSRPWDQLVREGLVEPAPKRRRSGPQRRIQPGGPVSELVAEQRR